MVDCFSPRWTHISLSRRRIVCCRRQERQLASTIAPSQLSKARGFQTAAARALHIKNSPPHKARRWWIRWPLLRHIHVLTVSLYICCQLLSRGEKHFPVFIWQPLSEASRVEDTRLFGKSDERGGGHIGGRRLFSFYILRKRSNSTDCWFDVKVAMGIK